jgi:hypothetical protein
MDNDFEIFDGKNYSSLVRDIYENASHRTSQVNKLVDDLRILIKGPGDIPIVVPFIKDYLSVANDNDANLVKLATTLVKMGAPSKNDDSDILSDEEKKQLSENSLSGLTKDAVEIKFEDANIENALTEINKKVKSVKRSSD